MKAHIPSVYPAVNHIWVCKKSEFDLWCWLHLVQFLFCIPFCKYFL